MVDEAYTEPIAEPAEIYRLGEEKVSDKEFQAEVIISADPDA